MRSPTSTSWSPRFAAGCKLLLGSWSSTHHLTPTSLSEGTPLPPACCPPSSIPCSPKIKDWLRISGGASPWGWPEVANRQRQAQLLGSVSPAACKPLKILLNSFTLQEFAKKKRGRRNEIWRGCQETRAGCSLPAGGWHSPRGVQGGGRAPNPEPTQPPGQPPARLSQQKGAWGLLATEGKASGKLVDVALG